MANLSKTLYTNFYQNRSTFAEVMRKSILMCFMPHNVGADMRPFVRLPSVSGADSKLGHRVIVPDMHHFLEDFGVQ